MADLSDWPFVEDTVTIQTTMEGATSRCNSFEAGSWAGLIADSSEVHVVRCRGRKVDGNCGDFVAMVRRFPLTSCGCDSVAVLFDPLF